MPLHCRIGRDSARRSRLWTAATAACFMTATALAQTEPPTPPVPGSTTPPSPRSQQNTPPPAQQENPAGEEPTALFEFRGQFFERYRDDTNHDNESRSREDSVTYGNPTVSCNPIQLFSAYVRRVSPARVILRAMS